MTKLQKVLLIVATVVAIVAAIIAGMSTFYTEFLWFESLGFDSVYVTVLLSQFGTGAAFGAVCFVLLLVHIALVKRNSKPREDWTFETAAGDVLDLKEIVSKVGTPVVVLAAFLVSIGMGYWASTHWEEVLRYLNSTPFGETEPILGKDVGFYLFSLPTYQFVQAWLVWVTGLCAVLAAVVYFLRGVLDFKQMRLVASDAVRGHLLFSLACVLLVLGWGWRIEMFETLFSKRGVAYGATYTDVHVNLIAYRIMIGVCVAAAIYLLVLIKLKLDEKKATFYPAYGLGAVVVLYLLGTFAWPTGVQQFVVNLDELDKEKEYLGHAIAGTRAAYGLDNIESKEFPVEENLVWKDIHQSEPTINNIKIRDHEPLQSTYKQVQVIRLYYDFPTVSVDRYWADDRYWQVMLSARELVPEQLPVQSQTWVNRHLQYTHGFGVCLSPVNRVVGEGLPDLWIKDIPLESKFDHMKVTRPQIYYGQVTNDFVLVKTNTQEFDYPKGRENKYTTYAGSGGVGIGSFFRRLLFAVRMHDVNLFFTRYLREGSRILFNRSVQDRALAVAPFLMLDQEPYMVVHDGRLVWIQDAYTISYRYPYSQPTSLGRMQRLNYIRNSVKVVIDAYNGKMTFYIWDKKDPMIRTYAKIFPELFVTADKMPKGLRAHVRYPKDLFTFQALMYESFHMTDPRTWYNQEDKWSISKRFVGDNKPDVSSTAPVTPGVTAKAVADTNRMNPYYMIMKLPEAKREEFLLMVPYTPSNKDNMVAWMTARCDGDNYGKLLVYTFPKKKLIFGPMQIQARIDQDERISGWITLRNQQGSKVIRGDLLVIPIKDSILYVAPIYLEATQTKLPELKQVIVSYGKKLTMQTNLTQALYKVFGVTSNTAGPGGGPAVARKVPGEDKPVVTPTMMGNATELLNKARSHYETAQKKLSTGDWAGYGAEQKALKATLDRLAATLQGQLKPTGDDGKVPDTTATADEVETETDDKP